MVPTTFWSVPSKETLFIIFKCISPPLVEILLDNCIQVSVVLHIRDLKKQQNSGANLTCSK